MKKSSNLETQKEKFIEMARELGCDESQDALDKAFSKIISPKPASELKKPRGKK